MTFFKRLANNHSLHATIGGAVVSGYLWSRGDVHPIAVGLAGAVSTVGLEQYMQMYGHRLPWNLNRKLNENGMPPDTSSQGPHQADPLPDYSKYGAAHFSPPHIQGGNTTNVL